MMLLAKAWKMSSGGTADRRHLTPKYEQRKLLSGPHVTDTGQVDIVFEKEFSEVI